MDIPTTYSEASLEQFVAHAVSSEAEQLGERWQQQARHVAPRAADQSALLDSADAARVVQSLGFCLRDTGCWQDEIMREGWDFGSAAHEAGVTLHSMLKEVDLLIAMSLFACERAAGDYTGPSTAADGIALARRLHRSFSLFSLAASKGFTYAYTAALRTQLRGIRHDLRNPLGTIQNALALMTDEQLTLEQRNNPRYQAMVARNARTLDGMIGSELGEAVALPSEFVRQEVSLRDVAMAVRRDLREEASEADCMIQVDSSLPIVMADSIGFELVLKSVVIAALRRASEGSSIHVDLHALGSKSAVVRVTFPLPVAGIPAAPDTVLAFARGLAERTGGRLWMDGADAVFIETRLMDVRALAPR